MKGLAIIGLFKFNFKKNIIFVLMALNGIRIVLYVIKIIHNLIITFMRPVEF